MVDYAISVINNLVYFYMNIALSGDQVQSLAGPNTKVLSYPQLKNVHDIRELLPKSMILYQTGNSGNTASGHWTSICCVDNEIYFFDSYGTFPDKEQNYIGSSYLQQSDQVRNKIQGLMKKSKLPLNYNEHRYQLMKPNINTCGRHSAFYLRSGLSTDDYFSLMSYLKKITKMPYDKLIVYLTDN